MKLFIKVTIALLMTSSLLVAAPAGANTHHHSHEADRQQDQGPQGRPW